METFPYFYTAIVVAALLGLSFIILPYLKPILKQINLFFFACFFNYGQPILDSHIRRYKTELFAPLHEIAKNELHILEIGAGSGTNFKYLPKGSRIVCVEPNAHMRRFLRRNSRTFEAVHVDEVIDGKAEGMNYLRDESMDAVIATFVLCSVCDVDKTLQQILRILKPGGHFCYLEHTLDSDESSWTQASQIFLRSVWAVVFDGCDSCNSPQGRINAAGFSSVTHTSAYMRSLFIPANNLTYGVAKK